VTAFASIDVGESTWPCACRPLLQDRLCQGMTTRRLDGDRFTVLEQTGAVGTDGIGGHIAGLFYGVSLDIATRQIWHGD